jgi:hypothetical protein
MHACMRPRVSFEEICGAAHDSMRRLEEEEDPTER